ncbi:hypothetical protein LINGRAHAP2_LOCUS16309 [Linum grandiflorum]
MSKTSSSSSSSSTILICSALAFLLVFGMVMEVEGRSDISDTCYLGPVTMYDFCLDVAKCTDACVQKYSPTATGKCVTPVNCHCYDVC